MIRPLAVLFTLAATALPLGASAQTTWTEGKNYFVITPALHTSVAAGKVEVTEVFSYGCPHCAEFQPVIKQLKAALPPNAVLTLIPASFNPAEDWPMLQPMPCCVSPQWNTSRRPTSRRLRSTFRVFSDRAELRF